MRLIKKNKNKRDCGIVAAYNAASWCNRPKSYKEVEKLAKSCGYSERAGIYKFQFVNLLKKLNIPVKKIKARSMEELRDIADQGKMLVFLYTPTGNNVGHAIVAFRNHRGFVRLFNADRERYCWGAFATDIRKNGMKNFNVYEIPDRLATEKYDDIRSA